MNKLADCHRNIRDNQAASVGGNSYSDRGENQHFTTIVDAFIRHVPSLVVVKDLEGRFLEVNALAERTYGVPLKELRGKAPQEVLPTIFAKECSKDDDLVLGSETTREVEQTFDWPDGPHTFHTIKFPIFDDDRRVMGTGEIGIDITQHKNIEEGLYRRANFDAVTELPNRQLVMDRLEQAVANSRRTKTATGILLVDLGDFTSLNEAQGRIAADWLLISAAHSLRSLCRESDTVGRLDGDKFCLLLPNIKESDELAQVATKVLDALRAEHAIEEIETFVQPSIGATIFVDDPGTGEDFMRCAKLALDDAKARGRNCVVHFDGTLSTPCVRKLKIISKLRKAIKNDELSLVYQPIFDAQSKTITSVEALLRWTTSELGAVPPDEFIGVAEEMGMITSIGDWVLETACAGAKQINSKSAHPVVVAINVSVKQLGDRSIVDKIKRCLKKNALDPKLLKIEMTESIFADDSPAIEEVMGELRDLGLGIAMDDFGTGYSSLAYLYKYRFSQIKIDRSFVARIMATGDNSLLVSGIIRMAHSLRLEVVAEGLETKGQVDLLTALGCDKLQGYFFSKPVQLQNLLSQLKSEKPEAA